MVGLVVSPSLVRRSLRPLVLPFGCLPAAPVDCVCVVAEGGRKSVLLGYVYEGSSTAIAEMTPSRLFFGLFAHSSLGGECCSD